MASAPGGSGQLHISSPSLIKLATWHHIAGIIDAQNSVMKIFIDGVEVANGSFGSDIRVSHLPLRIGWTHEGSSNFAPFEGLIDEVRIWNVARTQEQIQANKDIPLPNPTSQPGLVAYYQFEELKDLGIGGDQCRQRKVQNPDATDELQ